MAKYETIKIIKKSKMFFKKSLGFFETIYVWSAETLLKAEIIFNFDFILLRESWKGLCSFIW